MALRLNTTSHFISCSRTNLSPYKKINTNNKKIFGNFGKKLIHVILFADKTSSDCRDHGADKTDPPAARNINFKDIKPNKVDWSDIKDEPVDVLLLTAEDTDFSAAYAILNNPRVTDTGSHLGPVYFGEIGKNKTVLLKSFKGTIGVAGVQATCSEAVKKLNPKAIVGLGGCFGMMREKHDLGDVLVSSQVGLYGPSRVTPDGNINSLGPITECNSRLTRLFDGGKVGWIGPSEVLVPKVHVGLVISGPQHVENEERVAELKKRYPEALGGEMEGEGML